MKKNKKLIRTLICALAVTALAITGCGSEEGGEASVDTAKIGADLLALDADMPEVETVTSASENADVSFAVLADFDYEKVDSFYYSYSKDGSPEEIAVIAVKEKGDIADLMKALQAHIDSRRGTFEQYTPEKVSMVENAILTYQGKVILYAVSKKNGAMQDTFKQTVGQ